MVATPASTFSRRYCCWVWIFLLLPFHAVPPFDALDAVFERDVAGRIDLANSPQPGGNRSRAGRQCDPLDLGFDRGQVNDLRAQLFAGREVIFESIGRRQALLGL